ncbi:hypothetical protein BDN70DRAFT_885101 [Pholiota conissans]|uniref:GST N-terminal domain-containing protein n=1 Tax=Pholiota conissans TaxID=109636 RepID=A0A9P5YS70_9AGAR|nr:hypothetical protein BDN70DRAFT_885101 [Pholiota conissans]
MTITLFDVPSKFEGQAFSPSTWRIRYILNMRNIPYKTEWIELPDIESRSKGLGIAPTGLKPDGTPFYTIPFIHDPSTGIYLSDSTHIAEYLEKTYPGPSSIFPHNTLGLQSPFADLFFSTALPALWKFIIPSLYEILNPASGAYIRATREKLFGQPLEEMTPKGALGDAEWAKFREGLGKVDVWYSKTSGPYLLGDTISWADIVVVAALTLMKVVWGEDSQQWKDISSWHGGRWGGLVDDFKKYTNVV